MNFIELCVPFPVAKCIPIALHGIVLQYAAYADFADGQL